MGALAMLLLAQAPHQVVALAALLCAVARRCVAAVVKSLFPLVMLRAVAVAALLCVLARLVRAALVVL